MRKSQIITLIILFIAVTLFIWIGACSDKKSGSGNQSQATIKINTPATPTPGDSEATEPPTTGDLPTATPEAGVQRPSVDYTQLNGLGNDALVMDVSKDEHVFANDATKAAVDQMDYILSHPGENSKDIYMSFMLHWSDANPVVTKLLDAAKEKNAKFTFYVSKMYLEDDANADILKRIHNEGHTIGTRGDKSIDQLGVSAEAFSDSLWEMEKRYQSLFGDSERMYFFAPDSISQRNLKLANMMGYTVTFKLSNFVTDEGSRNETYNGILFQSSNLTDALAEQVKSYVSWAVSEGYTFKAFTK